MTESECTAATMLPLVIEFCLPSLPNNRLKMRPLPVFPDIPTRVFHNWVLDSLRMRLAKTERGPVMQQMTARWPINASEPNFFQANSGRLSIQT